MPNPDDLLDPADKPQQPYLRERINASELDRQASAQAVRDRMAPKPSSIAEAAPGALREKITAAAPQQQADARAVQERLASGPNMRQQILDAEPQRQAGMRAAADRITPPVLTDVVKPGNVNPSLRDDIVKNSVQAQNDAKAVQARLQAGAPPATPQPNLREAITAAEPQRQADAQAVQQRLQARAAAGPSARMGGGGIAQAAQAAVGATPASPVISAMQARPDVAAMRAQVGLHPTPGAGPASPVMSAMQGRTPAVPAPAAAPAAAGPASPVVSAMQGRTPAPAPAAAPAAAASSPVAQAMQARAPAPAGAAAGAAGAAGIAGAARAAAAGAPAAAGAASPVMDAMKARAAGAAAAPAAAAAAPAAEAAEATRLVRAATSAGKFVGRNKALLGRAGVIGLAAQAGTHFNDYKLNEPDVDSSAGGTLKALFTGDFAGAGKSALKGLKETAMDVGSAAANLADLVIPGKAPVSTEYEKMLREKQGEKLISNTGIAPAKPAPAAAPAAAAPAAAKPAETKPAEKPAAAPAQQAAPAAAPARPNVGNMLANARDEAHALIDNEEAADPRAVYYQTVNHKDGTTTYETRDRGQIVVKPDGSGVSPEDQKRIDAYTERQNRRDGIEQQYQQMLQQMEGGGAPSSPVADAARATLSAGTGTVNPKIAAFQEQYGELAKATGEKLGVDPQLLLAQWGHETDWGESVIPGTNNLGNIKAVGGQGGVGATDNMTGARGDYAQYGTPQEFADQYASLLNTRYPGAVGAGNDMGKFAGALKAGGYAEDSAYVDKLQAAYASLGGRGLAAAPAAEVAAAPAYGARDFRNPLAGAVEVIDMASGAAPVMHLPGLDDVRSGLTKEGYGTLQNAIRNNPALVNRMQVTNSGVSVDGIEMPLNVIAAGDSAMAKYARNLEQGQRFAVNQVGGKLAEEAMRGDNQVRANEVTAGATKYSADQQRKSAETTANMHRYTKSKGGVNQQTGLDNPDNIFDQSTGEDRTVKPPRAMAILQAQMAVDRGADVEAINAHLQSMYPDASVAKRAKK
jgi:flagellum-specific peptidoglycan hydrolase FlgJ